MLCDTFIRAPKRRQEPSYYDVVANPIDLLRVQQKLKTDTYDDIDELTADLELLVNNAKAFYKPSSSEYQDACQLWLFYNSNKAKLLDSQEEGNTENKTARPGRGRTSRKSTLADDDDNSTGTTSKEDEFDRFEEIFTTIMTATDSTSDITRVLCSEFQLLPSKKLYPDYYDVIEHPIDLKFIARKIQSHAYNSLNDVEKDFMQMIKNACLFNETGSQIYKDAKALKKIFISKKFEIENGRRLKVKRTGMPMSASVAALKGNYNPSDDDDDDEVDSDSPLWKLFDQLYSTANASGELTNLQF